LLENAIRSVPPEGHAVLTNLGYAKTLLTAAFEMNHGLTMMLSGKIYNLLSNAFKYADDKSELTVHWIYDPSTARTELRICGTGEPIKKEDRHRIFHPFTRGCEIQPTRYQASFGMGLWLARELMRRVKGDLHVDLFENDPKRSEFVVTFPTEGPYAIRWPIKKEMW
jgi:signal transduction histidine kinase